MTDKKESNAFSLTCEKANYLPNGIEVTLTKNTDGVFIEDFLPEGDVNEIDVAGLKAAIWEEIHQYNLRKETVSFSQNATSFYATKFRHTGFSKGYPVRMIHEAVRALRDEKKLKNEGNTQKIIAV